MFERIIQVVNWADWIKEQFTIKEEVLSSTAKKRKDWISPGIDGIQNYWWKKFKSVQRVLVRVHDTQ